MVEKTCIHCQKIIPENKKQYYRVKYCSPRCRYIYRKKKFCYISKYAPKPKTTLIKNCKFCNKIHSGRIFCSIECCKNAHKYKRKIYVDLKCHNCLKQYAPNKNNYRFCSNSCRILYYKHIRNRKEIQTQIKPKFDSSINFYKMYNYDKENYDGNRLWCLIRDDFTCQKCFCKEKLSIHHKDGKGFALSPEKRNNEIDNLITLCKQCHFFEENEEIKVENYVNKKFFIFRK